MKTEVVNHNRRCPRWLRRRIRFSSSLPFPRVSIARYDRMTIVLWLLSTDGFAAWDQVGDKCPENQGTKFSGRSNKTFSINFVFPRINCQSCKRIVILFCHGWHTKERFSRSLRRTRSVTSVCALFLSRTELLAWLINSQKNIRRISIHTHKKSNRHNFCQNENFVKKNTEKNTISLKSPNLQS